MAEPVLSKRFIEQSFDKFKNRTDTKWKSFSSSALGDYAFYSFQYGSNPYKNMMLFLDLRHVKSPELDSLVIDYHFHSNDWMFLRDGNMTINLDNVENIILQPHESSTNVEVGGKINEKGFWSLNKDELKKICDAKSISVRITGGSSYFELEGKGLLRFQFMCRSFYKDLYDDNSYDVWINSICPPGSEKKSNSGCFIATAAMGSYEHPVVMDLRYFRDQWLLKREWGQNFTNWYYTHGPKAARVIEKSTLLKKITYVAIVKPLQILTKRLR